MGFDLEPQSSRVEEDEIIARHRGAIRAEIARLGLLRQETQQCLGILGVGRLDAAQAAAVAEALRRGALARLKASERLRLDGSVTDQPDDMIFHRDDLALNYSTDSELLLEFVEFCEASGGFDVT